MKYPADHGSEPGGCLQWIEPLAKSVTVWKPDPTMPTPALDQHCKVWAKPKPYTTYEKASVVLSSPRYQYCTN